MSDAQKRWEIYTKALATPPPLRNEFLGTACGGDDALRKEVDNLLSIHGQGSPPPKSLAKSSPCGRARTVRIKGRLKQALRQSYLIQERIGGGGMGDLYLATHKTLGGKWAIKVLAEDLAQDPKVVERFVNEAKIEANLQHPNIAKVFHIGHSGGYHYFVMNYVEGEDLAERIARSGVLPEPEAVSIAFQICKALECAHDHNIVHRDLKPSNVRIDRYGTVVVIDFGIARARDVAMIGLTSQGERLGTPLYMSPEQVKGATIDAKSDLYSLGVLMYEMLSGNNPFQADSPHAVYAKHLGFTPPPLSEACSGVSPAISEIVQRLLEKDPEKRFHSARELGMSLRPLREGTEISPPARTYATVAGKSRDPSDRLNHVVRRVPETIVPRELSAEEKQVLELTDGKRTIGEILALSRLDNERFLTALESLKRESAVETLAMRESVAMAPAASSSIGFLSSKIPRRFVALALWALAILAVGVSSLVLVVRFFSIPSHHSPVQFTASPYAEVWIKDENGKPINEEALITPFQLELSPGTYNVEFRHKGSSQILNLVVQQNKQNSVHWTFWKREDTERLLERYFNNIY